MTANLIYCMDDGCDHLWLVGKQVRSFFVDAHQLYGFVFTGGSVDLHVFELLAAIRFR